MKTLHITSTENAQFKHLKKIASSARDRRKTRQTLIDGIHLLHALADANGGLEAIVLRDGAADSEEITRCCARFQTTDLLLLDAKLFDAISPVETPVGILGLMNIPTPRPDRPASAVLLENIQDPGNLGNILRSTAAAGIEAVYLSHGCAEAWSPKAMRAGMGAHFALNIFETQELAPIVSHFKISVATCLDAQHTIYQVDLTGNVAFIFGNEGAGLSEPLQQRATHKVTIPMPGKIESLNVGAAVAVCLFERVRQIQL